MSEQIKGDVLKNLKMEELLALGVDEIADSEQFKLVPKGYYILEISDSKLEAPDEGEPFIEVELLVNGIQELKDPTEEDQVTVGETKTNFRYYGAFGVQRFKTTFKSIAEHYKAQGETLSIFDLIDKIKGHQIVGNIEHRKVKPKLAKGEKLDPDDIKTYVELNPQSVSLAG